MLGQDQDAGELVSHGKEFDAGTLQRGLSATRLDQKAGSRLGLQRAASCSGLKKRDGLDIHTHRDRGSGVGRPAGLSLGHLLPGESCAALAFCA